MFRKTNSNQKLKLIQKKAIRLPRKRIFLSNTSEPRKIRTRPAPQHPKPENRPTPPDINTCEERRTDIDVRVPRTVPVEGVSSSQLEQHHVGRLLRSGRLARHFDKKPLPPHTKPTQPIHHWASMAGAKDPMLARRKHYLSI